MGPSGVLTIYSNGFVPLNKMASMPIYGKKKKKTKKLKNLFQNQTSLMLNLDILHWGLKVYQLCSNDDRLLTFDLLRLGQICVPMYLYGENVEKSLSQNE